MSEMVERVAQVLASKAGVSSPWDHDRALARRIIEAMRKPTDRMCLAAEPIDDDEWLEVMPEDVWMNMIDEALK